jgi:phospholipid transport system substrate-binding protein
MNRRSLGRIAAAAFVIGALGAVLPAVSWAADEAPDVLIKRLSDDTLGAIKADKSIRSGEIDRIIALVDSKIMPNVNFQRMTAAAVGPAWRQATPEQKAKLQEEFKTLLVRTYSGALSQVNDQVITVKPLRMAPDDKEVVVRTEMRGRGDPIQLDYRMEKTPGRRRRLEDLQPERAGRVAGRDLPQPVRAGGQRQGHRRPDHGAGRAQQEQRRLQEELIARRRCWSFPRS